MEIKTVTIALERHEELIKAEERLAVIKTIANQPHPYGHDKIRLIQAILEDKQCEITSEECSDKRWDAREEAEDE